MSFVFLVLFVVFLILWLKEKKDHKTTAQQLSSTVDLLNQTTSSLEAANDRVAKLSKYEGIVDAEAEAARILSEATEQADQERARIIAQAEEFKTITEMQTTQALIEAKESRAKAKDLVKTAEAEAAERTVRVETESRRIIAQAEAKAKDIAGEAYEIKEKADEYGRTATAMRNIIEGYGDEWLKPTYSLLDELADELSYTEAGKMLKEARAHSAQMVKNGLAAECDYVERNRKETAINFVIDAFNGKVDSILSKSKRDNYGKLEQMIRDAFQLVNYNGQAFRNARITESYLESRLQELHWAVIAQELRAQELEEQRQLREQMREEERARREFEKAQREAEKEAAMLAKAMEKAKKLLEKASEEQRAQYEEQIAKLSDQLKEAEAKGQHALSMAQQTKQGNVYVISNVGSFGENVYKVGMTRRLNPLDRVRELGDASVPFKFDVHAIIHSDDAPALEHALHQELALMQVNKVNPRKEFFRVPLSNIKALVERRGLNATWTMAAEAAEYRETLSIEESMKNDPDARARWEEFYASIADTDDENEEADA